MLTLLKTEWLKIRNYRAFILLGIFFCIGVFLSNYIVYATFENVVNKANTSGLVPKFNPYDFDYTWQTTSYATGFLLILPALILIMLVTNEFTYRTNRQNILDGWSREEFIDVKLVLALIFSVVSTILVIISGAAFGFATGTTFSLAGFSHVGYFFLKSLSFNLLAILVSVLVRRTGFAIGLYFIYFGAENIVAQLLDVWSLKLRSDDVVDLGAMGDYLPMNAADGLLTFPDTAMKSIAKQALPTNYYWVVLSLAIIYIILFFWLSRRRIIKSDL